MILELQSLCGKDKTESHNENGKIYSGPVLQTLFDLYGDSEVSALWFFTENLTRIFLLQAYRVTDVEGLKIRSF